MDDNFASIVKAIMWGRCVNDAVRKFLQFQISTNVTAVVITIVSAVSSVEMESVLTAVQLLWINIIMDTFAALALATDPATEALLDRKPDKKTDPLFSVNMYKQILFQSTYQIAITLIFHFVGKQILGLELHPSDPKVGKKNDLIVQTLVFNAFVFAQIFNSVNCRRLDNKLNIFEGITKNYYFIVITLLEIAIQVLIVFVGSSAFQVTKIGGREWGISLALGVVSIPLGALIRLMPNPPFERLFKAMRLLGNTSVLPTTSQDKETSWNPVVDRVRDTLGTFMQLRGGRLRSSSFVVKSRNARLSEEKVAPDSPPVTTQVLLAMAPAFVAGGIGVDWNAPSGSLSDPAHNDPSKSSAALWEGKIQIHPNTDPSDAAFELFGART
jgi:Ca2+-transporting ATPase